MKNRVYMIDYIGNSDKFGKPIGHPLKIINEYSNMLINHLDLSVFIPCNYKNKVSDEKCFNQCIFLKYYTNITAKNFFIKLFNMFKKLLNIKRIFNHLKCKSIKNSTLWFINVDFLLFLFLLLFRNKDGHKIIITIYLQNYNGGNKLKNVIKNYILNKGVKHVDTIITSNTKLKFENKNVIHIPDYFYDSNIYDMYNVKNKKNQVVCVGTITQDKDIEALIKTFNNINIPLIIKGNFYDKDRFIDLKKSAKPNIKISDSFLETNEYYTLIAESKYVILPYKKDFYDLRTSGVLIEAIFLNSIPIAPNFLLQFNDVNGLGYDNINELESFFKKDNVLNLEYDYVKEKYDVEKIRDKILYILQ